MPGLHSPEKLLQRRLRARNLGYLRPQVKSGHSAVFVRSEVAHNVKLMARSIELHAANQRETRRSFHYARDSKLAITDKVGTLELDRQLRVHRYGNRAKHRVIRIGDTMSGDDDPLFINDPWRGEEHTPDASTGNPSKPVCTPFVWNTGASVFSPSCDRKPILLDELIEDERVSELADGRPNKAYELLDGAHRLIEEQNHTIAFLFSQLSYIAEDAMHERNYDSRLNGIQRAIEKLSQTLDRPPADSSTLCVETKKPHRKVKLSEPAAVSDSDEHEKAHKVINDLRSQNAAQSACAARRDEMSANGRLLHSTSISAGAMDEHFPISDVFLKYVGTAVELDVKDPYLISDWQIANLNSLLDALLAKSHVRVVRLTTHTRSASRNDTFCDISRRVREMGVQFTWAFQNDLHIRELCYSNGVAILPDRGLDLFKAPGTDGKRYCRNSTILYYELNDSIMAKTANVAASVADEAKRILADDASRDLIKIEALVKETTEREKDLAQKEKQRQVEDKSTTLIRLELEGTKVERWIAERGLLFCEEAEEAARKDGRRSFGKALSIGAHFVHNLELCGGTLTQKDRFESEVQSWKTLKWLLPTRDDSSDDYFW